MRSHTLTLGPRLQERPREAHTLVRRRGITRRRHRYVSDSSVQVGSVEVCGSRKSEIFPWRPLLQCINLISQNTWKSCEYREVPRPLLASVHPPRRTAVHPEPPLRCRDTYCPESPLLDRNPVDVSSRRTDLVDEYGLKSTAFRRVNTSFWTGFRA